MNVDRRPADAPTVLSCCSICVVLLTSVRDRSAVFAVMLTIKFASVAIYAPSSSASSSVSHTIACATSGAIFASVINAVTFASRVASAIHSVKPWTIAVPPNSGISTVCRGSAGRAAKNCSRVRGVVVIQISPPVRGTGRLLTPSAGGRRAGQEPAQLSRRRRRIEPSRHVLRILSPLRLAHLRQEPIHADRAEIPAARRGEIAVQPFCFAERRFIRDDDLTPSAAGDPDPVVRTGPLIAPFVGRLPEIDPA